MSLNRRILFIVPDSQNSEEALNQALNQAVNQTILGLLSMQKLDDFN